MVTLVSISWAGESAHAAMPNVHSSYHHHNPALSGLDKTIRKTPCTSLKMPVNEEDVVDIMGGMPEGIRLNDHRRRLKNRWAG